MKNKVERGILLDCGHDELIVLLASGTLAPKLLGFLPWFSIRIHVPHVTIISSFFVASSSG